MNCKDNCLHYEVCAQFSKADGANHEYYDFSNQAEKCECFKDCHRGINDERLTPTADVVPVVRCKDCKYYVDQYCTRDIKCRTNMFYMCATNMFYMCADDFCSYGERKDEE